MSLEHPCPNCRKPQKTEANLTIPISEASSLNLEQPQHDFKEMTMEEAIGFVKNNPMIMSRISTQFHGFNPSVLIVEIERLRDENFDQFCNADEDVDGF